MWDETISVAAVSKEIDLPVAYWSSSNPQVDCAGIGVDVVSFKPGGGNQEMSGKKWLNTSWASNGLYIMLTSLYFLYGQVHPWHALTFAG
jgi:hypothetical protein